MTERNIKFTRRALQAPLLAVSLMAMSTVASADDIDFDGLIGVVTDYREKGVSLTGQDKALLGNVRVSHSSGLYLDGFMATTGNEEGDDFFADGILGYKWEGDTYIYNMSFALKSYHGDTGSRYFPEIKGSISRDFGFLYVSGGLEYAPEGRWTIPDHDSIYTFADMELPIPKMPDLTLVTHFGYDFIENEGDVKDWSVSVSAFYKDVEVSVTYDDSTLSKSNGSGTVSLGLKWYF